MIQRDTPITAFVYEMGLHAKDNVSGFEGIIIGRANHLFGCNTYGIAPNSLQSDGQVKKTEYFDEGRIEVLGDGQKLEGPKEFKDIFMHEGGAEVREKMTGFQGKIGYRVEYMHGCNQYGIIPSIDKDGKPGDTEQFDEGRLEVVGEGIKAEEVTAPKRGGLVNRDAPRIKGQ